MPPIQNIYCRYRYVAIANALLEWISSTQRPIEYIDSVRCIQQEHMDPRYPSGIQPPLSYPNYIRQPSCKPQGIAGSSVLKKNNRVKSAELRKNGAKYEASPLEAPSAILEYMSCLFGNSSLAQL